MPSDDKLIDGQGTNEGPAELESQFVLRMPPIPAASLRAAVRSGVMNLKDRLTIQIEPDMRHGTVRFDGWVLPSKIKDLPTVIESHKTLDKKNFYKTADICQIMICKEDVEEEKSDVDEGKKKDGNKKFLWPHGITAPLKNVRKKRFRKTLKKKFVDFPEIEKEVKRLFRMDNEATHVRYEVVNAEDDRNESKILSQISPGTSGILNTNSQSMDIVEHDLFGEVLSSSDDDDTRAQDLDIDDESSRLSVIKNSQKDLSESDPKYITEFSKGMITGEELDSQKSSNTNLSQLDSAMESSSAAAAVASLEEDAASSSISERANDAYMNKLNELTEEIESLQSKRQAQELEITNIENVALKQRFRSIINSLKEQEVEKRRQYDEILSMFN